MRWFESSKAPQFKEVFDDAKFSQSAAPSSRNGFGWGIAKHGEWRAHAVERGDGYLMGHQYEEIKINS